MIKRRANFDLLRKRVLLAHTQRDHAKCARSRFI